METRQGSWKCLKESTMESSGACDFAKSLGFMRVMVYSKTKEK
jgi:hypothetical protein